MRSLRTALWLAMGLASAGMVVAVCAVSRLALNGRGGPAAPPVKWFDRLVAEGVRCRDLQLLGFDRVSFRRMALQKRRVGGFALGAFNVLVVDDLVVNLPGCLSSTGAIAACGSELASRGVLAESLGVLLRTQGMRAERISGVRVNGLTVNRCGSGSTVRVLSARSVESGFRADKVNMRDCRIRLADGKEVSVPRATLECGPEPVVVFSGPGLLQRVPL